MSKETIQLMLSKAGVKINGKRPWDIQVLNEKFYDRILADRTLGVGESYMDGWWECERIDELICKVLRTKMGQDLFTWRIFWDALKATLFNQQGKIKAFHNAGKHYNIGNDLYEKMLDKHMIYSCGFWKGAKNLDQAQVNKMELICKKIHLKPGMKLLDIGCGWGGFAKYAAQKYKVKVLGITVSKNQFHFAKKNCAGLPIEIRLQDYRDLKDQFDRIVSVGMFEHVGYKNYRGFMKIAHDCLNEKGLFLLHTIGGNQTQTSMDPWIQKYIFPNALLPSIKQIGESSEGLLIMEDWHNIGPNYDKTLMAWFKYFDNHWEQLKSKYSQIFYRMWKFYLLSCAGSFRARDMQVWQILFSKKGMETSYLR